MSEVRKRKDSDPKPLESAESDHVRFRNYKLFISFLLYEMILELKSSSSSFNS